MGPRRERAGVVPHLECGAGPEVEKWEKKTQRRGNEGVRSKNNTWSCTAPSLLEDATRRK
jgi:hypothetical protein